MPTVAPQRPRRVTDRSDLTSHFVTTSGHSRSADGQPLPSVTAVCALARTRGTPGCHASTASHRLVCRACAAAGAGAGRRPSSGPWLRRRPCRRTCPTGLDGRPAGQHDHDPVVGARAQRHPLHGRRSTAPRPARSTTPTCPPRPCPTGTPDWSVTRLHRHRGRSDCVQHVLEHPPGRARPASPRLGRRPRAADQPAAAHLGASAGATSYKVEVDGDADFVGPSSYTTKNTSLVVPIPLGDGDWFWRVTASKGTTSTRLPARTRRFVVVAARRARRSPRPRTTPPRPSRTSCSTGRPSRAPRPTTCRSSTEADFSRAARSSTARPASWAPATPRRSPTTTPATSGASGRSTCPARRRRGPRPGSASPATGRTARLRSSPPPPAPRTCRPRSTSSGPRSRTPRSTRSRSAPRRTSPSARSRAAASPARRTRPGMFAVNTTGILAPPRDQRGLQPAGGRDQLLARARPGPALHQGRRHPRRPGPVLRDPGLPLHAAQRHQHGAARRRHGRRPHPHVGHRHRRRDLRDPHPSTRTAARSSTDETSATSYTPDGTTPLDPADGPFTWQITALGADRSRVGDLQQRVQRLGQPSRPARSPR